MIISIYPQKQKNYYDHYWNKLIMLEINSPALVNVPSDYLEFYCYIREER